MSDEGDFKKGNATKLLLGAVGVAAVATGVFFIARHASKDQLRPEDVKAQVRSVLVKPVKDQIPEWRQILDDPKSDERLREESIFQLARLRDPDSLDRFLKLLPQTSNHATIRVISMALLEYPRDKVVAGKKDLEAKFDSSDSSDQPQITSALIYIRDKEYFAKIFDVYKADVMKSAKAVDGGSSFDPSDLALLTDRATFAGYAKDSQAGVRQLVANVLSAGPTMEDLPALTTLLQDPDLEVSSSASVGIAKLNDASASKILVAKLADAQKQDNENASKRYMEALKNGMGGTGLVFALRVVPQDAANSEARGRFVLEEIRDLADPGAAQAYKDYIKDTSNPPQYRSQIALALADIGDAAAVPFLADRMDAKGIGFKCDPTPSPKCLSNNLGWKKQPPVDADPVTFREQQMAAQDIGDLAILYPDKKKEFLDASGAHLKTFNNWFPSPWLVPVRALALMGDPESLDWCKKTVKDFKLPDEMTVNLFSDPKCPKEHPECTLFGLNEFTTASRYVGYAHDASFVDILAKDTVRPKDKKGHEMPLTDTEMQVAQNPGFREAARNVAQAAVDGLGEWGPEAGKSSEALLKIIKDKDHAFFPRMMAGRALGMVASEKDLVAAIKDVAAANDPDAKVAVLMGAKNAPTADVAAAALAMIAPTTEPAMVGVNKWAARVVGYAGTKGLEDKLVALLDDNAVRPFAALAIVLGGDDDLVRRGMAAFKQKSNAAIDNDHKEGRYAEDLATVKQMYLDTFDDNGLTMGDVEKGRLFRFVHNAELMRRSGEFDDLGDVNQEWASIYLKAGFKRLDMNATVPGGIDRLILRYKLNVLAQTGDDATKQLAIDTLMFLKEQGSIMYLRDVAGATGEMARKAFFQLRHPDEGAAPDEKEKAKADPYFSKPDPKK